MSTLSQPGGLARETGRVEVFSDGIFSIAATLLVLDLKVPDIATLPAGTNLVQALVAQWPRYVALVIGFSTILVMWLNHHELFTHIARIDRTFLLLNGLLMLTVLLVPFPTALVAAYIGGPDERAAVVPYIVLNLCMALAFNAAWRYAVKDGRLLDADADRAAVQSITRDYTFGPPVFALAALLAALNVVAGLSLCVLLGVFYALPREFVTKVLHRKEESQ